jgi:hypothetical protein
MCFVSLIVRIHIDISNEKCNRIISIDIGKENCLVARASGCIELGKKQKAQSLRLGLE